MTSAQECPWKTLVEVAGLNGVPGPLHVLQLKDQLSINGDQDAALRIIAAEMKVSAQRLGEKIISEETELDRLFKAGVADESAVRAYANRIATLNGELRAVHLIAHLKTRRLLTDEQVVAYVKARGYGETNAPARKHH